MTCPRLRVPQGLIDARIDGAKNEFAEFPQVRIEALGQDGRHPEVRAIASPEGVKVQQQGTKRIATFRRLT